MVGDTKKSTDIDHSELAASDFIHEGSHVSYSSTPEVTASPEGSRSSNAFSSVQSHVHPSWSSDIESDTDVGEDLAWSRREIDRFMDRLTIPELQAFVTKVLRVKVVLVSPPL